ncbi:hypothetical protein [Celeribacter sp.]|uniref:hypothetical protein n=1 Tax=Celeribacter sp. TaxID=1890673 RepID=UPI003A93D867
MKPYRVQVSGLTFNAATQRFQARVIFHEGTDRITYPVELAAPITADFETVSRGLVLRARVIRKQERGANIAHLKSIVAHAMHVGHHASPAA